MTGEDKKGQAGEIHCGKAWREYDRAYLGNGEPGIQTELWNEKGEG